jgi:Phosphopantetheine attachment site
MDSAQARQMLLELFEQANIFYLRNNALGPAFLAGALDLPLEQLGMDSLAEMELCIGIEVNTGLQIVPEDLRQIETLDRLVAMLVAPPP